jgi:hypothetical protein
MLSRELAPKRCNMATGAVAEADTVGEMAKKQPKKGESPKLPRVNVSFPGEWHAVARRLAALNRQHVLYFLIDLLMKEAAEKGVSDLPVPPWERGDPDE